MNKEKLVEDIKGYLSGEKPKEEQGEVKKRKFIEALVGFFSIPEIRELLEKTGADISLIEYYHSYRLTVSKRGLLVKRRGKVDKEVPWPASYDAWSEEIPYGGLFSDGSRWEPDIDEYTKYLKMQVIRLLEVEMAEKISTSL